MACGTIQGCATNKSYYNISVIVFKWYHMYWATNRECGTNQRYTELAFHHICE